MYFLKEKLKKFMTSQSKLNFLLSYESEMKIAISNINQLSAYLLEQFPDYNNQNRDTIKFIANKYIKCFPDFRSGIIKDSKKKDLIQNMIIVNKRTISLIKDIISDIEAIKPQLIEDLENKKRHEEGQILLNKIIGQKDDYIKSFETVKEGLRAWECLEDLIEDGTIKINDLPNYGIHIEED